MFFSNGDTYERTIRDPDSDEERKVTLRPLMAGDRADIQDQMRIQFAGDDEDDTLAEAANLLQLRAGTNKLMTVAAAVVSWELEIAPTHSSVRALHPKVLDQIFDEVSWGKIPEPPSKEELDGDPLRVGSASAASDALELDAELSSKTS